MKKLILGLACAALLTGCWQTSVGEKRGVVVKVAKEGMFWGTYQGELIRGGLSDATGANGRSFNFNIGAFKSSLLVKLNEAMEKNKPISLRYHCEAWVMPWRGTHNCFADGVKNE